MNELKLVRLVTGEFAVGKVYEDGLTEVFSVQLQQVQQGQFKIYVVPYMSPFTDSMEGITIANKNILARMDCPDEVRNAYIQTTSNIMVADNLSMVK